jgi:hypothetical protein
VIRQIKEVKDRGEYEVVEKILTEKKGLMGLVLNSVHNFRRNVIVFEYQVNSKDSWQTPGPDHAARIRLAQLRERARRTIEKSSAEHV